MDAMTSATFSGLSAPSPHPVKLLAHVRSHMMLTMVEDRQWLVCESTGGHSLAMRMKTLPFRRMLPSVRAELSGELHTIHGKV